MRGKGCRGASTIHSLIYRARESGEEVPSFDLWDEAPASKAELIIIDECSMVDAELGRDLLSFGVPLLVLGDPAQLPPIQGGGFFTEAEPDVMLTEVHRQAQDNPIVRLSMDIRAGEYLEPGRYGETEVVRKADLDPERVLNADQVLVGRNATRRAYNMRMRERRGFKDTMPSAGDKLVCLRNNRKKGLFNGGLWSVKERGGRKSGIMTMRLLPDDETAHARRQGVGAAGMLHRRHRADRLAAPQALRRIRLRLRAHRAQGARLAMGRRRAVRRELRVFGQPRALALYRRHPRGEAADGGDVSGFAPLSAFLIFVARHRTNGSAASASAENAAPARNVPAGPATSHSAPARMLAASMAMPLTRLKTPKAVPRNSSGAVSATSAANRPCVRPMCRPHSATPIITTVTLPPMASARSARISSANPTVTTP